MGETEREADVAEHGGLEHGVDEESARGEVRIRGDVGRAIDRRPRQAAPLRGLEEVGLREAARERLDDLEDVHALGEPQRLLAPARLAEVRGLAALAHPRYEVAPHARVAAESAGHEAVARAEEPVWDVGVPAAAPPRDHAAVDVGDGAVLERRGHGVLDRDVDVLTAARAAARVERGQRADGRVRARDVIRLLARRRERRPVAVTAEPHHPAHRRRGEIRAEPGGARPRPAVRRDRHVNDLRPRRAHVGRAETERGEPLRRQGLDEDVGCRDERAETVAVARIVEVARHRARARAEVREGEIARVAARRLHDDHLRAEPDHEPAEERAGVAGEVDDADHARASPRPRYAWRMRGSSSSVALGPCTTMRPVSST